MEAMFYALAIKFLDKTELRKVKEKINMTLLGQMLMEDGIEVVNGRVDLKKYGMKF